MNIEHGIATGTSIPNNYAQELLVLEKGKGVYLEDVAGKTYLDFGSGISVNALGYGRADLAEAVSEQMRRIVHTSNLYTSRPTLELAEKLTALGNFGAVQFGNSGSEANESALKYARLYAYRKRGAGHNTYVSFTGSFHGRTMGALSVTPTEKYQEPFRPLIPGTATCRYNDTEELESIINDDCAAVIIEPVQGEGGLDILDADFAKRLRDLCTRHDVLLIADEVQSGLGRCGYIFASEASGLAPDIITLAKPLAGGLPLSATLLPKRVNDTVHLGDHGTTFGGGPVTCAAAGVVVDILTRKDFLADVREKGRYLAERLETLAGRFSFTEGVKGMGLLAGLAFDRNICEEKQIIPEIMKKARERGLLILRSGTHVLRIAPPLVITRGEIDEGVDILEHVLNNTNI